MDFSRKKQPDAPPDAGPDQIPPDPSPRPLVTTPSADWPKLVPTPPKTSHLFQLFTGLVLIFLGFYVLAGYTSFTAGQLHPGELVFSNTMVQLWTASYRLAFMFALALGMIGLTWQGLWKFFRPSADRDFDLATSIRNDLTPPQRIWLFFIVFFGLCYLFVELLAVKLPESISVSP